MVTKAQIIEFAIQLFISMYDLLQEKKTQYGEASEDCERPRSNCNILRVVTDVANNDCYRMNSSSQFSAALELVRL